MLDQIGIEAEQVLIPHSTLRLLISSFVLILSVVILKYISTRFIRRKVQSTDLRRKWIVQSRNGFLFLILFGLIIIWGDELRTLAFSLVAIAVAFVVATKELILCITGSVLKSGAGAFDIGDRIQIKDFRGDVVDQNLLTTTILEVGPGKITHQRTGRKTVLPNALFVSEPLINESYTNNYVLHVFTVPFKREDDWIAAKKLFLETANKMCGPFLDDVRAHMEKLSEEKGLDVPSVDPRVTLQVPAAGEIHLIIRVPAKTAERSYIEQSILFEVFSQNNFSGKKEG